MHAMPAWAIGGAITAWTNSDPLFSTHALATTRTPADASANPITRFMECLQDKGYRPRTPNAKILGKRTLKGGQGYALDVRCADGGDDREIDRRCDALLVRPDARERARAKSVIGFHRQSELHEQRSDARHDVRRGVTEARHRLELLDQTDRDRFAVQIRRVAALGFQR